MPPNTSLTIPIPSHVQPQRPDLVAKAIAPDYALSSHVAPLGLVFYTGTNLPAHYRGGAFVGEHGSWDRTVLNGYKIVYVPFEKGHRSGQAEDVVTGFLIDGDKARGRPVGLAVDGQGGLLIADDTGTTAFGAYWPLWNRRSNYSTSAISGNSPPRHL
jgi:glucose/arabinose dehydrogenase